MNADANNPTHQHGSHACHHGPLAEHRPQHDAICLDHVSYRYPADVLTGGAAAPPALDDVTLHVEYGCNLGIIGPNGAGKSTLIKVMLGLLDGYTGSVRIAGMSPKEACHRGDVIGYVPQRPTVEWRFPVTAAQVVRMGLVGKTGLFRWYRKADREYVDQVMQRVGVADLRRRPVGELSGGQQQRLFIARARGPAAHPDPG